MKTFALFILCIICSVQIFAQSDSAPADSLQTSTDSLLTVLTTPVSSANDSMKIVTISKRQGGWYTQNGRRLITMDLASAMRSNPKAHRMMITSRVCYWIMAPLAFSTFPVMIFSPLLGVGALAVAIPFGYAADALQDKAIDTFNKGQL